MEIFTYFLPFQGMLYLHFGSPRLISACAMTNVTCNQMVIFPPVPRMMAEGRVPQAAVEAVLVRSQGMPDGSQTVRGYDFNNGVDYHKLFRSFSRTGFQATSVGKAIEEIDKMVYLQR